MRFDPYFYGRTQRQTLERIQTRECLCPECNCGGEWETPEGPTPPVQLGPWPEERGIAGINGLFAARYANMDMGAFLIKDWPKLESVKRKARYTR